MTKQWSFFNARVCRQKSTSGSIRLTRFLFRGACIRPPTLPFLKRRVDRRGRNRPGLADGERRDQRTCDALQNSILSYHLHPRSRGAVSAGGPFARHATRHSRIEDEINGLSPISREALEKPCRNTKRGAQTCCALPLHRYRRLEIFQVSLDDCLAALCLVPSGIAYAPPKRTMIFYQNFPPPCWPNFGGAHTASTHCQTSKYHSPVLSEPRRANPAFFLSAATIRSA